MSDPEKGAFYDVRDVKHASNGRWVEILGRFGAATALLRNSHGPCPGCGGRDRFRFDDLAGDGTFLCSQGHGELLVGDGIALLMHIKGWEWKRCVQELGAALGVPAGNGQWARPTDESAGEGVAPEPTAEKKKRPELDLYAVWELTQGMPPIDEGWLMRRSVVDVESCDSVAFLRALYRENERVLVFTEEHSQGEFLYWKKPTGAGGRPITHEPEGTYRLAQARTVKAVPSALPTGGPKGVWFLTNPVSGHWMINPRAKNRQGDDAPQWSRRSMESITSWRYYVLESDVLEASEWLRVLANLRLPISAVYTSGGRSIHALMECEVPTKAHWDAVRDTLKQLVCPLGADPGALSAVRLSRLPGCTRGVGQGAKPQRLLYLNPKPDHEPIRLKKELR
jgi:hypothetical protein